MTRSFVAALALLVLPGIAAAQQAQATHTVVDGDTLWDLANNYYGDPFEWRRIWDANQADIQDPNLILPGQVITIPGIDAPEPEAPMPEPAEPVMEEAEPASDMPMRTIFYRDQGSLADAAASAANRPYAVVSRDQVYSAPRLMGLEGDPPHTGVLEGLASGRTRNATVRSYQRVKIATSAPVRVGDQLQVFTIGRTIEDIGRVVLPTGIVNVSEIVDDGVIGLVTGEYGRILPGQFVGPIPSYSIEVGDMPADVSGGAAAMVMGFASGASLQDIGHMAFLDLGATDGIDVGDVFTMYNTVDLRRAEGHLQVVGVQNDVATARVVDFTSPVFEQGTVVRLTKKMR